MKEAIKVFKALADRNRLRIVKALMVRPLCVCELQKILNISQPSVSHHLKILSEAGIIEYERDGQWMVYNLVESPDSKPLFDIVSSLREWFENDETIKKDRYIIEKLNKIDICYGENDNE